MIQMRNLDQALQAMVLGNHPGMGDVHYLIKPGTKSYDLFDNDRNYPHGKLHPSLLEAEMNLTELGGSRNDVLVVTPESHSLDAAFVWDLNMTHIVGSYPGSSMNVRNRIGMSTTFSPMITISGYGNIIADLYTMHGTAATDYIGWLISGARNHFVRVHFGGPMNAAQGGHASYEGVAIDGSENTFDDCVIGTDTIGRDEVSPNVTLGAGTLTRFRNCLFLCNLTDGDPVFFKVENTSGYTWALFENCKFLAFNSNYATAMTKAFHFTGAASAAMVFDPLCSFQNVTALAASDKDQHIWLPQAMATTTDTSGLINVQLSI